MNACDVKWMLVMCSEQLWCEVNSCDVQWMLVVWMIVMLSEWLFYCAVCFLYTQCFSVKSVFVVHPMWLWGLCLLFSPFYCEVCVCCSLQPRFYCQVCVCCAPQGPWLELWKHCLPSLCPEMPTCNVGVCQTGVVSTRTSGLMSALCSDANNVSDECSDADNTSDECTV